MCLLWYYIISVEFSDLVSITDVRDMFVYKNNDTHSN